MPKIETWGDLPDAVRGHLIERMRDRSISIADLNQLRLWIESKPDVPDGEWYKDFGSFKICGQGPYPKTFLLRGQDDRLHVDLIRHQISATLMRRQVTAGYLLQMRGLGVPF